MSDCVGVLTFRGLLLPIGKHESGFACEQHTKQKPKKVN